MNKFPLVLLAAAAVSLSAPTIAQQSQEAQEAPVRKTEVLYSSTLWQEQAKEAQGDFRIVQVREGEKVLSTRLELGESFSTKSGPDLKVVLSPLTAEQVSSKTALTDSLVLGALRSASGASSYDIPAGTDLGRFHSVLIHCQKYTKLWVAAPLSPGKVVASGHRWTEKDKGIRGSWEIAEVGKAQFLRLGSDFKTKSAPDLKLVLSPLSLDQASNDNALEGGTVIADLGKVKGAQEYRLPAGTDWSKSTSLLIHCAKYSKLWGGTELPKK